MSPRTQQLAGRYSVVSALAAVVIAPLFAVSYFATSEGAQYLAEPTIAWWAEPARRVLGGLVTFASPDRVYSTFLLLFTVAFGGLVACALMTRRLRPPERTRPERWGWRITLGGYGLFGAGAVLLSLMLLVVAPTAAAVNVVFMATIFPGLLVSLIGATILGVALLRGGHRPRFTPCLLALAIPLWVVGSLVLGHNSIGMVPQFLAWGATGWALQRQHARQSAAMKVQQPARPAV
jgi:hypothetical protein